MVSVLQPGDALTQVAFMVFVHIGQARDTGPLGHHADAIAIHLGPNHVPENLGAVGVASLGDPGIERLGQMVING